MRRVKRMAALRRPRTIALIISVLVTLMLLVMIVRVGLAARDLQTRVNALQQLAQSEGSLNLAQARGDLSGIKNDLAAIRGAVGWLFPLAPLFVGLPQIGPDIVASPAAFNMAESLVAAADLAFDAWSPALEMVNARSGDSAPVTERLIEPLLSHRTQLAQAQVYVQQAAAQRSQIDLAKVSPRFASVLKQVDRAQPLMSLAVDGGLALPQLLGANGVRSYLIVAQNADELRATGGFVSAAGRLTLDHGKIVELEFMDSYQVDNLDKEFPQPPMALQTYMLAGYWLFRDANWSPDFPTSARQLASLYTLGQEKSVDGVIALDQAFVRDLLKATGPLELKSNPATTVSAENLTSFMRAAWTPAVGSPTDEAWLARKNFIGALAKALQMRLLNGNVNAGALGRALYNSICERHLLIYVSEPTLAQSLSRLGWDGAVQASHGDYLQVVDSNVGFNKANALITQSMRYEVAVAPDFAAHATLSIRYRHNGPPSDQPCVQRVPDYGPSISYEALMNQCYWNYLRLYAPKDSVLEEASRYPIAAAHLLSGKGSNGDPQILPSEAGKDVFATFFVVEQGREREVRFRYDLPGSVLRPLVQGAWQYSLYWQKQAGLGAILTEVSLLLPKGVTLVRAEATTGASPAVEATADGLRLSYQFDLTTDFATAIVVRQGSQ